MRKPRRDFTRVIRCASGVLRRRSHESNELQPPVCGLDRRPSVPRAAQPPSRRRPEAPPHRPPSGVRRSRRAPRPKSCQILRELRMARSCANFGWKRLHPSPGTVYPRALKEDERCLAPAVDGFYGHRLQLSPPAASPSPPRAPGGPSRGLPAPRISSRSRKFSPAPVPSKAVMQRPPPRHCSTSKPETSPQRSSACPPPHATARCASCPDRRSSRSCTRK
jgi:hypothetical protein